jgi:hypothetical protein
MRKRDAMNEEFTDPAITELIREVVNKGSAYQIEEMEKLYTSDQSLLYPNREGSIDRSARAEMIAEFTARRDSGEPHLSTSSRAAARSRFFTAA